MKTPDFLRFSRGDFARWGVSAVLILMAHGAVAWTVLTHRDVIAPTGGVPILIELDPLPVAPQQTPSESAPGAEQTQTETQTETKPEPEKEKPVEPQETTEKTEPQPEKPETTQTAEPPKPAEPPPIEPKETAETKEPPPIPPPPVAEKPDVSVPLPPKPPERPKKKVAEKKKPAAKPKKQAERNHKKKTQTRTVQTTTAPNASLKRAERPTTTRIGVNAQVSIASWKAQIAARLQRYKRYPAGAQAQRQTGTAYLQFTIDRGGHVLSARLARSSGIAALDQETLSLVHRAQPFPPIPAGIAASRYSFSVPIRFEMR